MLIPLCVVMGIGCFFTYCALQQRRAMRASASTEEPYVLSSAAKFDSSSMLERPTRWLAIRSNSSSAVQAALKLQRVSPCSWEEGLAESGEKLFVSPPIAGWVLVVGSGLPVPSDDIDNCYKFLRGLSKKLGHVEYYSVNRALNHHAWALLEGDRVLRAYAWAGETLWNEGLVTAAERDLGMVCFDYCSEVSVFTSREALAGDTDKLNQLAARWSLDPATIPQSTWKVHGIVGEF
jgi:hypothetical protein